MSHIGLVQAPKEGWGWQDWLTKVMLPVGAMAFAGLALFEGNSRLPSWIEILVGIYLAVGIVFGVLHTLRWRWATAVGAMQRHKASGRHHPRPRPGRKEFLEASTTDNSDTLPYLLRGLPALCGNALEVDGQLQHIQTLRNWATSIKGNFSRTNKHFTSSAEDFSRILWEYNSLFIRRQRELEVLITQNKFSADRLRDLKRDWNLRRERHAAMTEQWRQSSRTINTDFGTHVCGDFYEQLPSLE